MEYCCYIPVTIETNPNAIPIQDSTIVIVQAHPFPFNNPYAITKYAIPTARSAANNVWVKLKDDVV
jgi:hypothetical protein